MFARLFRIFIIIIVLLVNFGFYKISFARQYTYPKVGIIRTNSQDFDVLLLDFNIVNKTGFDDVLDVITLKNLGSAFYESVWRLNLWIDKGKPGFQGLDIDERVARFKWNYNIGWLADNLDLKIPSKGQRFFITADLRNTGVDRLRTLRVFFHKYFDANKNNKYDFGDLGIFMKSGNNDPEILINKYNEVLIYNKKDDLPPKMIVKNLQDSDTIIIDNNKFIIKGSAKDNSLGNLVLRIKFDTNSKGRWIDIKDIKKNKDDSSILNWTYTLTNIKFGVPYKFSFRAVDSLGNVNEFVIDNIKFFHLRTLPTKSKKQNKQEVSLEKSVLRVNRDLAIRAPFMDKDIYAEVILRDKQGNPIPNKLVTINASRPGKNNILTLRTNEKGRTFWVISSTINAEFTLSAIVDNKVLLQKPKVKFIDARLKGRVVKGSGKTVYLLKDNARYVFPTQDVFLSYYKDFSVVEKISDQELKKYPIKGNITFRPGSLIKIKTSPKVYRVNENKIINWIETEEKARSMYGPNWASLVYEVPVVFFSDYKIGSSLK